MSTDIATRPLPAPERVGQHTAVEMSRAVAEVYAQVQIARDHPRDEQLCRERMLKACASLRLADRAFYNFPRSTETVTGMTIHVAVALARCWGNLLHGLAEMSRDDVYGQSEMQAFCWELETNERHSQTFFVQHVRHTKRSGSTKLEDPRDIQDNNTNIGNRRWREAIFKALPVEFVEEAEHTLRATLMDAVGAESIEEAREKALQFYRDKFGINRGQLEYKMRRPVEKWKVDQLVELRILGGSIMRREIRLEDAFPSAKVTVEELADDAAAAPAKPRAPRAQQPESSGGQQPAEGAPNSSAVLTADQIESGLRDAIEAATTKAERDAVTERAQEHEAAGRISYDQYEALLDLLDAKVRAEHPGSTGHHVHDAAADHEFADEEGGE